VEFSYLLEPHFDFTGPQNMKIFRDIAHGAGIRDLPIVGFQYHQNKNGYAQISQKLHKLSALFVPGHKYADTTGTKFRSRNYGREHGLKRFVITGSDICQDLENFIGLSQSPAGGKAVHL
jgi:hypothetical protein